MKKGWIILLIISSRLVFAQEDEPSAWTLNGYLKQLHSVIKIDGIPTYLTDNLWHNRLKIRFEPDEHWQLGIDVRTRMFYGDLIKLNPGFAAQIEEGNNAYFDLSIHLVDKPAWLVNSTLDRAYIRYNHNNWEITAGRQRINWGISTVWNPHDVFNAFSFTDFDYEERPATDALRVKYYMGFASSIELAANLNADADDRVVAGLIKWNTSQYDFQVLTGYVSREWTLGGGWAGNIKNAGFKGEWTYFNSFRKNATSSFSMTAGIDYSFSNGLFFSTGYLYNSNGKTRGSLGDLFSFELSAKNLYPFRHALLVSGVYPITPLFSSNLAIIYSPSSSHPLFVNPGFTYSIAQSWDLDLVGQLAFNKEAGQYSSPLKAAFIRIKLSF